MFSDFFKRIFGKKSTKNNSENATPYSKERNEAYMKFLAERMSLIKITRANIYHPDIETTIPPLFDNYEDEIIDFARKCESSFSYIAASHISEKITGPTLKAFYEALLREKAYIIPPFDEQVKKKDCMSIDPFLQEILEIKYNKVKNRLKEGGYRKKSML